MVMYINPQNKNDELKRNALLLYPYINNNTISHGRAAKILGITKYELIDIYDSLGLAYLSLDITEVEDEIASWDSMKGNCNDSYIGYKKITHNNPPFLNFSITCSNIYMIFSLINWQLFLVSFIHANTSVNLSFSNN
jgi:hypothetical protein